MNKKILYLECSSGISGDMTVAALLDLGADRQVLTDALASLPLEGYSIEIKDVFKSGIRACDFNVILDHDNHDHDMAYLHDHTHKHSEQHDHPHDHLHLHDEHHDHSHDHLHSHDEHHDHPHDHLHSHDEHHDHSHDHLHSHDEHHDHSHDHLHSHDEHHGHSHHHDARNLDDVIHIINHGRLTDGARSLAIRIFRILAEAEAAVHGKSLHEVHFHEVGAVDSIVDIAAAAVCLDNLAPDSVVVSPLTDGTGQIRCQHGIIPVPVPAVAAISEQNGLVLKISNVQGELVTPTGAAIAAALQSDTSLPTEFRIRKLGFGAGKRDYATTGLLRAMLIEPTQQDNHDIILNMETNIDDCSGEALSFTMQQLLEHGALDAFYTPIYMKKNRPAFLLRVICTPDKREEMESVIFRNTTTIGIRVQEIGRTKLDRKIIAVETPWGMADIKCCTHNGEIFYYPENDSVVSLARANEIGFPEMYSLIQAYAREHTQQ